MTYTSLILFSICGCKSMLFRWGAEIIAWVILNDRFSYDNQSLAKTITWEFKVRMIDWKIFELERFIYKFLSLPQPRTKLFFLIPDITCLFFKDYRSALGFLSLCIRINRSFKTHVITNGNNMNDRKVRWFLWFPHILFKKFTLENQVMFLNDICLYFCYEI